MELNFLEILITGGALVACSGRIAQGGSGFGPTKIGLSRRLRSVGDSIELNIELMSNGTMYVWTFK